MELSAQPDLTAAIDRYCGSLQQRLGVLSRAQDASVPAWLDEIKVLVSLDLWRRLAKSPIPSTHVVALCQDLADLGISGGVAIRLQGFQGPARLALSPSSIRPRAKRAVPACGRSPRQSTPAATASWCRATSGDWTRMPRALHPLSISRCRMTDRMSACLGGQVGPYEGWPGAFPVIPTGYDSGFVALQPQVQSATQVTFEPCRCPMRWRPSSPLPGSKTAGYGTLRAVVNGREVQSNPGAFTHGDRVRFRFRFRFAPETNVVQLTFAEGLPDQGLPDLSRATYRLNGAIKGGRVWSHPLVRADITHPEWIAVTRNNLGRMTKEYGIDILYIDDLELTRPAERAIFDALCKDLPVWSSPAWPRPSLDTMFFASPTPLTLDYHPAIRLTA